MISSIWKCPTHGCPMVTQRNGAGAIHSLEHIENLANLPAITARWSPVTQEVFFQPADRDGNRAPMPYAKTNGFHVLTPLGDYTLRFKRVTLQWEAAPYDQPMPYLAEKFWADTPHKLLHRLHDTFNTHGLLRDLSLLEQPTILEDNIL